MTVGYSISVILVDAKTNKWREPHLKVDQDFNHCRCFADLITRYEVQRTSRSLRTSKPLKTTTTAITENETTEDDERKNNTVKPKKKI